MRSRFLWFTFEREAKWLVVLCALIPLLLILFAIVIPAAWRALVQSIRSASTG